MTQKINSDSIFELDKELKALNIEPKRILIVEDDLINVMVLEMLLAPFNFILETAENGQIGLDKFKNTTYDVILMDIYMPVMDGFEASRRIREISATPPIIVISAAMLNEENLKEELGIDYFVPKPVNITLLKQILHKILISKKSDA